jgi:hypothetical protein
MRKEAPVQNQGSSCTATRGYIVSRGNNSGCALMKASTASNVMTALPLGLAVYLAFGSLTWPLGFDQAVFSWVGDVILNGGVPYSDAWEIKGPLTHYCYALAIAVIGHHEISLRVFDLIAVLVSCWLMRRLLRLVNAEDWIGWRLAAVFFVICYFCSGYWHTAQPDAWGGMLLIAVVSLLVTPLWPPKWAMATVGTLIGLATLLKPSFVIFMAMPLAFPISTREFRARLSQVSWCVLGFLLATVVPMCLLFRSGMRLRDFIDILYFLSSSYAPLDRRDPATEAMQLYQALIDFRLLIPVILTPLGIWLVHRGGKRREAGILAVWAALAMLVVILQGKYIRYHFVPLIAAMAVILGFAVVVPYRRRGHVLLREAGVTMLILLTCWPAMPPWGDAEVYYDLRWPAQVFGFEGKNVYLAAITGPWHHSACEQMAEYVDARTTRGDTVLVWGWEILVNVLSSRQPPTRFGMFYPLVAEGPLRPQYRRMFLEEIVNRLPKYIIVDSVPQPSDMLPHRSAMQFLEEFAEFSRTFHAGYRLEARVDEYEMWRRID